MASIIDVLPGRTLPVSEVNSTLATMWHVENAGEGAPTEFRASQMNLILHFGKNVEPAEACAQFHIAIRFAQRYPCRIIVLCPEDDNDSEQQFLEAKLYSQCFIGSDQRAMCCCEALILGYYTRQNDFLENQVSVWLENDLPVYYWFYKVPARRIQDRFLPFLRHCRRVVYDSSVEADDYDTIDWPEHLYLEDLAYARLLSLRQCIGQYLSAYSSEQIASGLEAIHIRYHESLRGEALRLLEWVSACARVCAEQIGQDFVAAVEVRSEPDAGSDEAFDLVFSYKDRSKSFSWIFIGKEQRASMRANLGQGIVDTVMKVDYLNPEKALAEALFFESKSPWKNIKANTGR